MPGEQRETMRQLLNAAETQRLLSTIFSISQLQDSNGGLQPLHFGNHSGIWYLAIGRRSATASVADFVFFVNNRDTSSLERSSVLEVVEEVNHSFDSNAKPVRLIPLDKSGSRSGSGFPTLMVDMESGEVLKGQDYSIKESLDPIVDGSSMVSTRFPYPYHPQLNDFLRSLFLTRGLLIKPPLSRGLVMNQLVEDAYQHSIGIKKEVIRKDFQEMMKSLVGSKVFKVKGDFITYLTDFTEYRRRFTRNYYSYMDRQLKKTIFDF